MNYNNISNDWDQQLRDTMIAIEEEKVMLMQEYIKGEKIVEEMLKYTLAN